MKKSVVLAMTAVLLLAVTIPGIQAAQKTKSTAKTTAIKPYTGAQDVKHEEGGGITAAGWVLLAGDAALAGLSVYFLMDERSAADSYNKQLAEIDNTTQANYDLLVQKKTEIDGKILLTGVSTGLAAAAVLYTLADAFLIHAVFPASTKISYDPGRNAVMLSVSRGF